MQHNPVIRHSMQAPIGARKAYGLDPRLIIFVPGIGVLLPWRKCQPIRQIEDLGTTELDAEGAMNSEAESEKLWSWQSLAKAC